MSHTLTNYNGVQIVTPQADLSADRQALNANFEFLADNCLRTPIANSTGAIFDGTNSIQSLDDFMQHGNDPWSLSVWIRTTSTKPYNAFGFWGSAGPPGDRGMTLLISADWGIYYQFVLNVPFENAMYGDIRTLERRQLAPAVATYYDSTLTIYVDNVPQTLAFAVPPPPDGEHCAEYYL